MILAYSLTRWTEEARIVAPHLLPLNLPYLTLVCLMTEQSDFPLLNRRNSRQTKKGSLSQWVYKHIKLQNFLPYAGFSRWKQPHFGSQFSLLSHFPHFGFMCRIARLIKEGTLCLHRKGRVCSHRKDLVSVARNDA